MKPLSLVTLNVERSTHLALVHPFLSGRAPDIVCLQELMERDVKELETALGMRSVFVPMSLQLAEVDLAVMGIGVFSKYPIAASRTHLFYGNKGEIMSADESSEESRAASTRVVVLVCDVEVEGGVYRVATTHLPKSEEGHTTARVQQEAVQGLLVALAEEGDLVLCGDFNAPRGQEIFAALAARYIDNVPPHYTSSIDGAIHRAGPLPFMVDGIFSTPAYKVEEVEMVCGVSDHCALVAKVLKVS